MPTQIEIPTYTAAPENVGTYGWDWSPFLAGATIASSTWTVPAGLTQPFTATHDLTSTTVWLTGGTLGTVYRVVNHVVASDGREESWTFQLRLSPTGT